MMREGSYRLVPAQPRQNTAATIEIYFAPFSKLNISNYIFKVFLKVNERRSEIYSFSPTSDPEETKQFKQLNQTLIFGFIFQSRQQFHIEVLEKKSMKLFGSIDDLTVGEIFNSRREGVIKQLKNGQQQIGPFFISYQPTENGNKMVDLQVQTNKMSSDNLFLCCSKDRYYFQFIKHEEKIEFKVYQSQLADSPNYIFQNINISTRKLCNNQPNQQITISFYNRTSKSLIGSTQFTLGELARQRAQHIVKKDNHQKGIVMIQQRREQSIFQFTDFLTNGMQMALTIAIDFTSSNGPITNPESLHYRGEGRRSLYEIALSEVVLIVLDYDYDKKVPLYGFGAKVNYKEVNTGSQTTHLFPLNGLEEEHDVHDFSGILQAYSECLPHLTFSGPTFFAPLLQNSMRTCKQMKKQGKEYMILMILTDGQITDFELVVDLIVQCSRLPISIIIIGISTEINQRWPMMHKLDNCLQLKDSFGRSPERDLVKFVQFNKYYRTPGLLAEQVLQELPRQVEEYHSLEGIEPNDYRRHLRVPDYQEAREIDENKMMERLYSMPIRGPQKKRQAEQDPQNLGKSKSNLPKFDNLKSKTKQKRQKENEIGQNINNSQINLILPQNSNVRSKQSNPYTPRDREDE